MPTSAVSYNPQFKEKPWQAHANTDLRTALCLFTGTHPYEGLLPKYQRRLQSHPFGRRFDRPPSREEEANARAVTFKYAHGSTDMCARFLSAHVREMIDETVFSKPTLRIFGFPTESGSQSDLDLFYEVGMFSSHLVAGNVTNCSGAGQAGQQELDSLFLLLVRSYDAKVHFYQADTPCIWSGLPH